MNAADLTRPLVLERRSQSPDGAGGFSESWQAIGTLWASMTPRSGRLAGGEETRLSLSVWRIIVRAAPAGAPSRPQPGQRFRDGGRVFAIRSVAERGADWLDCAAEEESAT